MSRAGVEIVSVLYGGEEVVRDTLASWFAAVDDTEVSIRLLDNSPDDALRALVENLVLLHPTVSCEYVSDIRNLGFAASANGLLRTSTAEWAILLNPDIYLDSSELSDILSCLSSSRLDVGAIAISTQGRTTIGVGLSCYGYFGDRPVESRRACLGPSGGAAAYRIAGRRPWMEFDEDLFAWGEDAGAAVRLWAAGVDTFLINVTLRHIGGHSVASDSGQRLKTRLLARNRILVLRRDFSRPFQLTVGVVMLIAVLVNGLFKVRRGLGREHYCGVLQGFRMSSVTKPMGRPRIGLIQFLRYAAAVPKKGA